MFGYLTSGIAERCNGSTKYVAAAISGGVVAYLGWDRTFIRMGAGPMTHHALAGVALDYSCRGPAVVSDVQGLGMSAASGLAGAYIVKSMF